MSVKRRVAAGLLVLATAIGLGLGASGSAASGASAPQAVYYHA